MSFSELENMTLIIHSTLFRKSFLGETHSGKGFFSEAATTSRYKFIKTCGMAVTGSLVTQMFKSLHSKLDGWPSQILLYNHLKFTIFIVRALPSLIKYFNSVITELLVN